MRIEPISLFSGGGPDWSVVRTRNDNVVTMKRRLEMENRLEAERIDNSRESYRTATTALAVNLNDKQAWNYTVDGNIERYDVSGAMFFKKA